MPKFEDAENEAITIQQENHYRSTTEEYLEDLLVDFMKDLPLEALLDCFDNYGNPNYKYMRELLRNFLVLKDK